MQGCIVCRRVHGVVQIVISRVKGDSQLERLLASEEIPDYPLVEIKRAATLETKLFLRREREKNNERELTRCKIVKQSTTMQVKKLEWKDKTIVS